MTPLRCEDWRACDPATIQRLLDCEALVWRRELDWDVTRSWRSIESARSEGRLPGCIVTDGAGAVLGWTWFLSHNNYLQVGALVGQSPKVVRQLVQYVMTAGAAAGAEGQVWSVRSAPPGLAAMLEESGLAVDRYAYLSARLSAGVPDAGLRGWSPADLERAVVLADAAYEGNDGVRIFAPGGTRSEWREYFVGLFGNDDCGRFLPEASFVIDDGETGRLAGAIVTSAIAPDVAHIAQVAVEPSRQGRGDGRRLVQAAMGACRARGFRKITLLVSATNAAARRLYGNQGFVEQSSFLAAASQPRRSTSVALATGGASTRR